jgi:hypothetical protein
MTKEKNTKKLGTEPVKKEVKKPLLTVNLNVNLTDLVATGDTLLEAFNKFEKPDIIKTYALFTVKGNPACRKQMNIVNLKNFFANLTYRKIIAKQMSVLLK